MKYSRLQLFALLICCSFGTSAQSVYTYQFNNNLHCKTGGPDLVAVCAPTYSAHTFTDLGGVVQTVCHFNQHCGFVFHDTASFISAGAYSIEMLVEMDNTSGFRKIIDYMNRTDDNGLYDVDGACVFRGPGSVSGSYFTDNTYHFITVTRNGTTKAFKMFVDGHYVDGFNDNDVSVATYDANKTLRFMQDDTYSSDTECTGGNIALLRIYNYALDSSVAIANYGTLGASLGVRDAKQPAGFSLWPNPATCQLNVTVSTGWCQYYIFNSTGKRTLSGTLLQGTRNVDIADLPAGLYLFEAIQGDGQRTTSLFTKM